MCIMRMDAEASRVAACSVLALRLPLLSISVLFSVQSSFSTGRDARRTSGLRQRHRLGTPFVVSHLYSVSTPNCLGGSNGGMGAEEGSRFLCVE